MQAQLGRDGVLVLGGERFRAAYGRGGIRRDKQEGDDATPAGVLPVRRLLYRADRIAKPVSSLRPVSLLRIEPIAPTDGWCDDSSSPSYNRRVTLPFDARCEELWRSDSLYDLVGVLGWNDDPVRKGFGSAIFLHIATPDYAPTEGCIALALPDLVRALGLGLNAILVGD